ncbi:hypothetical protein RRG08_064917 [Elysia crispata]|uniref:BTB domain-containing protein n=1 Tax=Elysia crispata TaxID=231223 RepID=A0AAE1A978_9GAST|nr:hypothetical protein RRG08_064917 [Elysia crispata]
MSVSDHFSRSILKRMFVQWKQEPHDDIIVEVENKTFHCHRFILSASSMFFKALCRSDMSETVEKKVELKDLSADIFQLILDCIYGGKEIITKNNALSIWQAASLLQIDFLQEACDIFLIENSDKENCVDVYKCAKLLNSDHVSSVTWDIILREFDYLVASKDIFLLEAVDLERLVKNDNLQVHSEDMVVSVIIEWSKLYVSENSESGKPDSANQAKLEENLASQASSKKGKKAKNVENGNSDSTTQGEAGADASVRYQDDIISTLLGASRLCLASSTCLQELLTDHRVLNNPKALFHVRNALRYHLQPERRYDFCPSTAVFRSGNDWTNVILCISSPGANNSQPNLICKRCPQDKWHTLIIGSIPPFFITHEQCNSVFYEKSVFGTTCDVPKNQTIMFHFNLQLENFVSLGNVPRNRVNHTTVCYKNFLYIIGGDNGELSIERCNLENTGSIQWETVGTLTQSVSDVMATVFNDLIIIIGNIKKEPGGESTVLIQCFDPEKKCVHLQADSLPQATQKRVFLKRWSEVYLLQEGGDLWQLHFCEDNYRIILDYHGRLWNSPVDLTTALIFKEELIVLAKPLVATVAAAAPNQSQSQGQDQEKVKSRWETPHHELFKRVHVLREDICCLMTGVVPSAMLLIDQSMNCIRTEVVLQAVNHTRSHRSKKRRFKNKPVM